MSKSYKDGFTSRYRIEEEKKNFWRLEDEDAPGGNARKSLFPFPYIRKELMEAMGNPAMVRITITPLLPEAEIEGA